MSETFHDSLLRAVAAELHLLNRMTAAREMFAKSYFSLGVADKRRSYAVRPSLATHRGEHRQAS
jgi:hypothetical protein